MFLLISLPVGAAPQGFCQARKVPYGRALLDISIKDLINPDLLRLIQLGLSGSVHMEIVLWQSRRMWFDKSLHSDSRDLAITWSSTDNVLIVGERPTPNLEWITLDPITFRSPSANIMGTVLYVEVNLRLEVVTTESLKKLTYWMVGQKQPQTNPSIVPTAILRAIANDLSREVRIRCHVEPLSDG